MSIGQLARAFNRSKGSIRHWLAKYGLRTRNPPKRTGSPVVIAARAAGDSTLVRLCPRHGETKFVLEGRGYYRCTRCRVESVVKHRRKVKAILIAEAGGACAICGYARSNRALEFHHVEPSSKEFALAARGITISLADARLEAQKCVLLCSNCHAEVEDGLLALPIELRNRFDEPT